MKNLGSEDKCLADLYLCQDPSYGIWILIPDLSFLADIPWTSSTITAKGWSSTLSPKALPPVTTLKSWNAHLGSPCEVIYMQNDKGCAQPHAWDEMAKFTVPNAYVPVGDIAELWVSHRALLSLFLLAKSMVYTCLPSGDTSSFESKELL